MNILYSTDCPKCRVLISKLDKKGISYEICKDKEKMMSMGMLSVPMFQTDNIIMNFKETVDWLNKE